MCALALTIAAGALPACSFLPGGGDTYEVITYFPRAVSVFESSDVRVLGLPAGTVTDIEVQGDKVKITLAINESIPIPADANAQIVPLSLIGERYIQISPAWRQGLVKAEDGHVIDLDRTIVPVEPDEALAALKDFLDSLDPKGVGDLVGNLAEDLEGNGESLGGALEELSDLVATFADKDEQLLRIVDSFDRLTSTLTTREQQLGQVLDAFAAATGVLADERKSVEALLRGLATLSEDGLDLVSEHAAALRTDIDVLTRTVRTIDVNLASVEQLLDSGPLLVKGLLTAYNPDVRAINLRQNFSPLVSNILDPLLGGIGLDPICIPIDVDCPGLPLLGQAAGTAAPAVLTPVGAAPSPIDGVLELIGAPSEPAPHASGRSAGDRIAGVGGFVADAARTLLGLGS